jgi:hypothetical protein
LQCQKQRGWQVEKLPTFFIVQKIRVFFVCILKFIPIARVVLIKESGGTLAVTVSGVAQASQGHAKTD